MITERERLMWYAWSKKEEIGYGETRKLLLYYGNIEELYRLSKEEITQIPWISERAKKRMMEPYEEETEYNAYMKLSKVGAHFILPEDEAYPTQLKQMYDPPWFLYYKGDTPALDLPCVAIIGARACTAYGATIAKELAKKLATRKIQIISGLAKGIDGYAHKGALEAGGRTYGVIGSGLSHCYPKENEYLYEEVSKHGGILSEYPMHSQAIPFHFPIRNRIIAGLSDSIVVVEAKEKSGTLITVDSGLEQGKDIYAIPGKITDPLSIGCNRLIQNGAKLVQSAEDIIEELSVRYPYLQKKRKKSKQQMILLDEEVTEEEKCILKELDFEPIHLEQLLERTSYSITKVMEILFVLQTKEFVKEISTNYYIRLVAFAYH
ncbi:DNA-processing protein DprA [Anaerosporobacter faecicola]|uniref:DNA-processing protein DprA n=1 Tax=Anaerosporobacter faecicola TaxID=2718714 RepID=UPI001438F931|nr:DNA-processing protein DprA [Anaerosporobacter faecicola]